MSIREHEDLPDWVWDLIDALDKYEDEHPLLYRMTDADVYERTECFGPIAEKVIPAEVRQIASVMRARVRNGGAR